MIMLALLTKFLAREAELVVISAKGKALETVPRPEKGRLLVFPGSFDPLHEGHTELAAAALDATKQRDDEPVELACGEEGGVGGVGARLAASRLCD